MSYLPTHLQGPPAPAESAEQRFARRLAVAALLRRRRLEVGLTFRQVAHAAYMDASRVSRYEQAWQYPSAAKAEYILEAIARLEKDGAGNPERAAQARAKYAEEDEAAAGTGQ